MPYVDGLVLPVRKKDIAIKVLVDL